MKSKTDWKKLKSISEKEIMQAAKSDPDAQPLSTVELKKFKRVHAPETVDVKAIRNKLHLSQEEFAGVFGVKIRTVQEWEQHRRTPTATARNFLRVVELAPRTVQKILSLKIFKIKNTP